MEKIRNTPHVEGNFATHISLRLSKNSKIFNEYIKTIKSILDKNNSNLIQYESIVNESVNYYHMSLCNNFYLKYHQIDNFLNQIKKEFSSRINDKSNKSLTLVVTPIVKYFNNENKNRNFLALEILKNIPFKKTLGIIIEVLSSFGIAPYYDVSVFIFKYLFFRILSHTFQFCGVIKNSVK